MSDWKQKMKEAKEWVDLGVMTLEEFEDLKQQARAALGLGSSSSSGSGISHGESQHVSSTTSNTDALFLLVPILQKYSLQKKGGWLDQKEGRLKGYLLDHLSSDVAHDEIRLFVNLSYHEHLLSVLLKDDSLSLEHHYSTLIKRYNEHFVLCICKVWGQVLSLSISLSPRSSSSTNLPIATEVGFQGSSVGDEESAGRGSGRHDLAYIPSGEFMMGALPSDGDADDREKPRHRARISRAFWLGKYQVTQQLYKSVTGKSPSHFKGEKLPVEQVSWTDAVLFCNMLSGKEGLEVVYSLPKELTLGMKFPDGNFFTPSPTAQKLVSQIEVNWSANGYRLPTEAEWEYAGRGGGEHLYSGSNDLDEVGWHDEDWDTGSTHSVGEKKPNGFGLYDMSGNVWEWCWDIFRRMYTSSTVSDPRGPSGGSSLRVYRGGGWYLDAKFARLSYRCYYGGPGLRNGNLGFRVLRVAEGV